MTTPYIKGENVYLRALEREDIKENYLRWMNDKEVTKYMSVGNFPVTKNDIENYYEAIKRDRNDIIFAIICKGTDKHIGNVRLGPIDSISKIAPYGIMIGEKDFWSKGYGSEVTKLIIEYAFKTLNVHKIVLRVNASNKGAIKAYEKAGLKVEGVTRSEVYINGRYHDQVHMGLLKEEYLPNRK